MSSRKMSLSGWRPTVVMGFVRARREPAFGPRVTTSRPAPAGMSSRSNVTSSSGASGGTSMLNVIVVRSPGSCSSGAPHDEQKFAPNALRCPHWLQKTSATFESAFDQRAVGVRGQQLFELRHVVGFDHDQPTVTVG